MKTSFELKQELLQWKNKYHQQQKYYATIIENLTKTEKPEKMEHIKLTIKAIKPIYPKFDYSHTQIRYRGQSVLVPRQISMYLLHKFTKLSLKQIGLMHGGRDHSTVINAIRAIEDYRDTDRKFATDLHKIENNYLNSY